MAAPAHSKPLRWLLGNAPEQRVNLRFWLSTTLVYLLSQVVQYVSVVFGLASLRLVMMQSVLVVSGLSIIYLALRSGWSRRLADPSMTMWQMGFAQAVLTLAYAINPHSSAAIYLPQTFVLMFGAFTLQPRQCRNMGWLAEVCMSAVMLWCSATDPALFPPRVKLLEFLLVLAVLPSVAHMAGRLSSIRLVLHGQKRALSDALERISILATHDELTGLANRRRALEIMAYEERRATRSTPPCIGILDIDHFKRINDTLGHAAGDAVLQRVAEQCKLSLRDTDVLARWGGEEFVLLMPETHINEAMQVLQRLHRALAAPQAWADAPERMVTFSAGLTPHVAGEAMQSTVARADAALYRAKQGGRNRTELG